MDRARQKEKEAALKAIVKQESADYKEGDEEDGGWDSWVISKVNMAVVRVSVGATTCVGARPGWGWGGFTILGLTSLSPCRR